MKFRTNRQLSPFSGEELRAMQNHTEDDRLLLLLLRWTGIRPTDAIGLTWGEVSFARLTKLAGLEEKPRY
jgi:integrase